MRRFSQIVAVVFAAMLLLPSVLVVSAQDSMFAAGGEYLDVAAMALTPNDLDDLGYADYLIADGRAQSLEDRVAEQTTSTDDPEEIRSFLTDLGWIRGYRSRLAHPLETGTEDFDALISSGITQFADEDGAHRGWELVSNLDVQSGGATLVDDAKTIGDESRMIDVGEQSFDAGETHPGLRIVFRSGTLVGDVIVFGAPGEAPTPAAIEKLAARQLERMEDVAANGAPDLSLQVLRWQGDNLADPDLDNYLKLDGEMFVGLGDTEQDIAQAAASFADATDYYRYEVGLTTILFQYTSLARFPDKTTAKEWVTTSFERTQLNTPEGATLEEVKGAPSFGDASVVMKVTTPVEGGEAIGYAVYVQIGSDALSLAIISLDTLEENDVLAMGKAQVDCFKAKSCADSVALPEWVDA